MIKKSDIKGSNNIFYICLVMLSVLGTLMFFYAKNILVDTDAQRYAILANNFLLGRWFTLNGHSELIYAPGYSTFLIPLIFLGFSQVNAVTILSTISYLLLGFSIFLLVSNKYNKLLGLLISFFVVINGNVVLWSILGNAEVLMWSLLLFSFYFLLREKEIHAGAMAGLAYLVKPESLLYLGIFIVFLYIKRTGGKKVSLKRFFVTLGVFVIPYVLYLYINTGSVLLSGKSVTIAWDRFVEDSSVSREEIVYRLNPDNTVGLRSEDVNYTNLDLLSRAKINILDYKQAIFEILLPFSLIFPLLLVIFVVKANIRGVMVFLGVMCVPTMISLLFHLENRYLIVVLISVIATLSLASRDFFKRNSRTYQKIISLLSLIALLYMTYYSYLPIRDRYDDLVLEKEEVVQFITENEINEGTILSRKPVYSFFLQKDYYPLPWVENKEMLDGYLKDYKDSVVILDNWSLKTLPITDKILREDDGDHRILIYEK